MGDKFSHFFYIFVSLREKPMAQENLDINYKGSLILENTEIRGIVNSVRDVCLRGVVVGDIQCEARVRIEKEAVVKGNIACDSLESEGLIQGNVEVKNRTELAARAVINGYLITSSLVIQMGAVVEKGLRLKDK